MQCNTSSVQILINMNGQKLEELTSFNYLGATLCKDGTLCSAEIHIRIVSAMAAMARLNRIWWCNTISLASKFKLYKSCVTPSSMAVKHGPCLLTEKKVPNQVPEKTSLHLILGAQDQQQGVGPDQLNFAVDLQKLLSATVKKRKLAWFSHVTCHDSLSKTIVH